MESALDTKYTPRKLGRYDLISDIATGGMGEVHLARLKSMEGVEKLVAIKILLPQYAANKEIVSMFVHEARIASRMNHPNICQVFELGMEGSELFICMEFLRGIPLTTILRSHSPAFPVSPRIAAGLIHQACVGLHYAHELKDEDGELLELVHRDITPSNLMLTHNGAVKILDFGVVKARDAEHKTRTGALKGKFAYMSPEQLKAAPLDRRADVFALGIVLFELLTNEPLFNKETEYETLRSICELEIPKVADFQPSVPDELSDLVARALSRDRDDRFSTAKEMAQALSDVMAQHGGLASVDELNDFINTRYAKELGKGAEMVKLARDLSRLGQLDVAADAKEEPVSEVSGFDQETRAVGLPDSVAGDNPVAAPLSDSLVESPPRTPTTRGPGVAIGLVAVSIAVLALAAVLLMRSTGDDKRKESALVYQGQLSSDGPATNTDDAPAVDPDDKTDAAPDVTEAENGDPKGNNGAAQKRPSTSGCAGIKDKAKRNGCYLRKSNQSFSKCLSMHEEAATTTQGLTLKVELSPAGKVESASLLPARSASTPLGTCLLKAAKKVRFGPQGERVRFSIPLKIRKR